MRLSIGVPAYNQGKFLQETLESVLNQDEPFFEVVVSNNHSTDSTADVIAAMQARYPDRIRLVRPPQHLSMSANWNFTVSQLRGDWFALLSSDDLALPNFVRSVRKAAALADDAVLVRGAWRNIGMDGEKLADKHLLSVSAVTRPPKTIYEQRYGPKGSFAAFALRRDIWEKLGGFPESVTLIGDWAMWVLTGAYGAIVYTDDLISCYRTNHQNEMYRKRYPTYLREMFTMYSEILPHATNIAGQGKPSWIAKASRKRFRDCMIDVSQNYEPGERSQIADAIRPWAAAAGQQALLERFERGEVLRDANPLRMVRSALRPVASALRSARAGSR